MATIKLTSAEWLARAHVQGANATVIADGNDYNVTVNAGAAWVVYRLDGPLDGSITVFGAGNGNALRAGAGDGNAWRWGAGDGDALRWGAGDGHAWRDGIGDGHAFRDGTGDGDAYIRGVKQPRA